MSEASPCPTCGTPVQAWERYPNALCAECVGLAQDEQGRTMRFGNETMLGGGFIAEIEDGGVWRPVEGAIYEATCWVKGTRCVAREHRFGGIVVQTVAE